MSDRERWLNGWGRRGGDVIVGTMIHCAGCGLALAGPICVVFDAEMPDKDPDWPFDVETCPLSSNYPQAIRLEPEPEEAKGMYIGKLKGTLPK